MDEIEESRWIVAELDFGHSPDGMLVVRETRWTRGIGVVCGLLFGIPVSWAAVVIFIHFNDIGSALFFSAFAGLALGGALWLIYELLNAKCFYWAIDNKRFYRRWGPRRLVSYPLDELGEFYTKKGALYVGRKSTTIPVLVMKNAYAPENTAILARRVNVWRSTPQTERKVTLSNLNLMEAGEARTAANKQIAKGLGLLGLYPLLIVLSLKFQFPRAPGFSIVLSVVYTMFGLLTLFGGIVRRVGATLKAHP